MTATMTRSADEAFTGLTDHERDIAVSYMMQKGVNAQQAREALSSLSSEVRFQLLQLHPDPRVSGTTSGEMFTGGGTD